jgi:hypothetical protein
MEAFLDQIEAEDRRLSTKVEAAVKTEAELCRLFLATAEQASRAGGAGQLAVQLEAHTRQLGELDAARGAAMDSFIVEMGDAEDRICDQLEMISKYQVLAADLREDRKGIDERAEAARHEQQLR